MGIQVASFNIGNNYAVNTQQDLSEEKRPPLPAELKLQNQHNSEQTPDVLKSEANQKTQFPDIKQTTSAMEKISLAFDRRLKFEINQESKEILIKVIDNETDKVIKVLPPEELQRLHSRLRETMGFLFDRMV